MSLILSFALGSSAENLLRNATFTELDANGHPVGWGISHPSHLEKHATAVSIAEDVEKGEVVKFLHLVKNSESENLSLGAQIIAFPAGTASIRIRAKMRGINLLEGKQPWQMAGIGLTYLFEGGGAKPGDMGKWIRLPRMDSDWVEYETLIPVRDNATQASVSFVSQGWSGTLDVQWITAEALPPAAPAQPAAP